MSQISTLRASARAFRIRHLVIAATIICVAAGLDSSCFFDTRTTQCGGLICKPGQICAANQDICVDVGGCGDGKVNGDEVCDDGNLISGDGCSSDCMSKETCGNGYIDTIKGESCDDGQDNGTDKSSCSTMCILAACGNGTPDLNEDCDPGNSDSPGCNSYLAGSDFGCHFVRCGDGYPNAAAGEDCDTRGIDTDTCNGKTCKASMCGDQVTNLVAKEQCDTGGIDTRGCNGGTCKLPACGDGYKNPEYIVPEIPATDTHPIIPSHNEECDGGKLDTMGMPTPQDSPDCDFDCTKAMCGDGYINTAANEQCDNSANNNDQMPDACRTNCLVAHCGDNVKDTGEECDNGTANSDTTSDACRTTCLNPRCGDGVKDSGEQCDMTPCSETQHCNELCKCVQ